MTPPRTDAERWAAVFALLLEAAESTVASTAEDLAIDMTTIPMTTESSSHHADPV